MSICKLRALPRIVCALRYPHEHVSLKSSISRNFSFLIITWCHAPFQAVTSWVQAFAFDASGQQDGDGNGVDGDRDGFFSEGEGEGSEDMSSLQMECTVHEVLLKNQVRGDHYPLKFRSRSPTQTCLILYNPRFTRYYHYPRHKCA